MKSALVIAHQFKQGVSSSVATRACARCPRLVRPNPRSERDQEVIEGEDMKLGGAPLGHEDRDSSNGFDDLSVATGRCVTDCDAIVVPRYYWPPHVSIGAIMVKVLLRSVPAIVLKTSLGTASYPLTKSFLVVCALRQDPLKAPARGHATKAQAKSERYC